MKKLKIKKKCVSGISFLNTFCFYKYDTINNVISIPKRKVYSKEDLFAMLHELGHRFYKHTEGDKISKGILNSEMEAWKYALVCLKKIEHNNCITFAIKCMKQYENSFDIENKFGLFIKDK